MGHNVKLTADDFVQVSGRQSEEFRSEYSEASRLYYGDVAVLVLQIAVNRAMLSEDELLNLTRQVLYARYLECEKSEGDKTYQ